MKKDREIITSRQNESVKAVRALADKKGRARSGLFRFDGIKLFRDALGRADIFTVVLREPMSVAVSAEVQGGLSRGEISEDRLLFVSESVFNTISEESSPEGIITVARQLDDLHAGFEPCKTEELSGKRLLLVESIRDPGNLGTVMRSCGALGIDTLILSDDCADIYNPKTVRSSMGALFRLPTVTVKRDDMPRLVTSLRQGGRRVFAAALRENAFRIGELTLKAGDCFVIGNEGHGLSDTLIDACDGAAIIPMTEGSESLNAAAAAAICIWETVRASQH